MPKYIFTYKEVEGTLEYSDSAPVKFKVVHSDPKAVKIITDYLNKETDFPIPESQRFDDYRIDRVKPTKDRSYFELALCTMYADTDLEVHLYWEREVK